MLATAGRPRRPVHYFLYVAQIIVLIVQLRNLKFRKSLLPPKRDKKFHHPGAPQFRVMEALGAQRKKSVVLVGYPLQGHITPMLQLGSILNSKSFSVIIAHTEYSPPNSKYYPDFTFVPLSDGLAGFDMSFNNTLNVISAINSNCKDSFQEYMVQRLDETDLYGEVACIIYDAIMAFVDPVAVKLKIPTIVLRTTTAACMYSHFSMFQLEAEKVIPLPESQLQEVVPNFDPFRFKDLPFPATIGIPEVVTGFLHSYQDTKSSSAVIWNSSDILELSYLDKLQQNYWQVPFFPIGPFHKVAPALPTSMMEEDTCCLSWLDKQAPKSVIYVSLGSVAIIDEKALTEMAWGLAKSELPFLWVVRSSLLGSSDASECLPDNFFEITKGRGCIVKWAPQKKVLAHSSVGGFLTHCGWNSTLESMCEGVPMICRPVFSDQIINARYLTDVWKVGLELEQATAGSIEEAVKNLMVSEEGKELRKKAIDMKQKLEETTSKGGLSHESLEHLVEFIISLSGKKM